MGEYLGPDRRWPQPAALAAILAAEVAMADAARYAHMGRVDDARAFTWGLRLAMRETG